MLLSGKSLSLLPLHLFGPVKAQQSQVGVAGYQIIIIFTRKALFRRASYSPTP